MCNLLRNGNRLAVSELPFRPRRSGQPKALLASFPYLPNSAAMIARFRSPRVRLHSSPEESWAKRRNESLPFRTSGAIR